MQTTLLIKSYRDERFLSVSLDLVSGMTACVIVSDVLFDDPYVLPLG